MASEKRMVCGDCRQALPADRVERASGPRGHAGDYCPHCAKADIPALACPHCGSLLCGKCGSIVESADELGIG